MKNINKHTMKVVILQALANEAGNKRWVTAITRAATADEHHPTWTELDAWYHYRKCHWPFVKQPEGFLWRGMRRGGPFSQ